ncbi:helix-turn-helix domain-containing protein [Numidum massiliense]|uniref:helix-turn-helix domain-containing protein n=1 Tax=Numidum massiliense TaxID=1522315 RepID=UPI0006D52C7E|nr:tetratricopeptide repeat protein [Numidum massiliense]
MTLDPISLGSLIRQRRKALGLTLNDLANENISVPTISNIERGITGNVVSDKVAYIREKLGLTDEMVEQMMQKTEVEQERFARQLSFIRHLTELELYDEARKEVSALEKDERLNDFPLYATTAQLLKGIVLRKQGQWERAKKALNQVLRLLQEEDLDDATNLAAEAYFNLSIAVVLGDQDYEQGIAYTDKALEAFCEDGEGIELKGRILYQKGAYYLHLERYGEAFRYVMEARDVCESSHDIKNLLLTYNLEANVLKRQHLYDRAITVFQQAIDLASKWHPEVRMGSVLYLNLGDAHYHKKMYDQALRYYDISYNLCRKTTDQDTLAILYFSYAEIYYETKQFAKATEYVNKAAELAQKFNLTPDYLRFLLLKAKICSDQNSNEVKAICEEGLRLAEQSKLYNKKRDFHFVLASYYEQTGNREVFRQEAENMYFAEAQIRRR